MAVERTPRADAGPRQDQGDAPSARPPRKPFSWAWVGVVPFFLFAFLFLFLPSVSIFAPELREPRPHVHLSEHPRHLSEERYPQRLQAQPAGQRRHGLGGAFFGFLLAYAVTIGGLPKAVRNFMLTFSGVASNFAGVPLAFAFVATMGNAGLVTRIIEGADRRRHSRRRLHDLQLLGSEHRLHVLPVPADGADHGAGAGRPAP